MNTASAKRKDTSIPALDYIPEPGAPALLSPGLLWLRMPLPFELNHINLWLMESPSGWTIVDTGFNFAETLQHWDSVFRGHFGSKPVENIFVTHFHPDHFGLAAYLADRTGLTVQMTAAEFDAAQSLTDDKRMPLLEEQYRGYYTEAGVDEKLREEMIARRFGYRKMVPAVPKEISAVNAGEYVVLGGRQWKIIGGYGHCPEHACLFDSAGKVFISGDIVLPTISPNISLYPGSAGNPVGAYLETLERVAREVPDDVLVLPSHGVPFTGLHRRLKELREHHGRRFEKLHAALSRGKDQTAFQLMTSLFSHRELKPFDVFFALGETFAHIAHEEQTGKITRRMQGDVALFSAA